MDEGVVAIFPVSSTLPSTSSTQTWELQSPRSTPIVIVFAAALVECLTANLTFWARSPFGFQGPVRVSRNGDRPSHPIYIWSQAVERGSAFAGLGVRIPGGENRFDYRTGEAFQLNLRTVVPITDGFDVVPKLSWLYTEPDKFQGEDTFATGGHVVSIVPGIRVGLAENVDLEAAIEISVFRNLRTESLQAAARFSAGITVTF